MVCCPWAVAFTVSSTSERVRRAKANPENQASGLTSLHYLEHCLPQMSGILRKRPFLKAIFSWRVIYVTIENILLNSLTIVSHNI